VAINQNHLLEEGHRLDELHRSYDKDAELNEPFIVLTLGAGLIATLGLLANNSAVVIGAMVVAPWIMPLRTTVFAILVGDWRLLRNASQTLAIGFVITTLLALCIGLMAGTRGLLLLDKLPDEIIGRLNPNLIDLAIALVAGAMATYAKVRPSTVSSMAGTAIAVALVPPVCVMGLMIAGAAWGKAEGSGLLFAANLFGILIGGLTVLAIREPYLRSQLLRSRRTKIPFISALALSVIITIPLHKRFVAKLYDERSDLAKERIEFIISDFLENKTLTFGANESLALNGISFDWPNFWEQGRSPVVKLVVRVTNPKTPSYKQVQIIQDKINNLIGSEMNNLEFQIQVQRLQMSIVEGDEVPDNYDYDDELPWVDLEREVELTEQSNKGTDRQITGHNPSQEAQQRQPRKPGP